MKNKIILLLAVILIADEGCKKSTNENTTVVDPQAEKKWVVTTVAGSGEAGFADGSAPSAKFKAPLDIAVTEDGIIYVADGLNHRIRKIAAGQVSTFAGNGNQGTTNGLGTAAEFSIPSRLASDIAGNIYTLDAAHPPVRQLTPAAFVAVHAGTATRGFKDGAAVIAQFNQGFGITTDALGNIYIGDTGNRRIRQIKTNGQVITIAGNGMSGYVNGNGGAAQFLFPTGIVIDKQGNLFVADQHRIRKITPTGIVSTFAGNDEPGFADGQADVAKFTLIEDLAIDGKGNIYASDNNRIRKISVQGIVSTIAGSEEGFADGDGAVAKFNIVQGLAIDKQGNIYVADANNNRIRKLSFE
ncbi:MAG: NHL repeat-containing protein [Chitinophagaceae bacterium]